MSAASLYREHAPSSALRPFVECFWSRPASTATPYDQRVLPDGCIDLLTFFDAPTLDAPAGCVTLGVGTMTTAQVVSAGGAVSLLGVRFKPGMARIFLDVPANELTDADTPLGDVIVGAESLPEQLSEVGGLMPRIALLESFLLNRLRHSTLPARHIAAAVARIDASHGAAKIVNLAGELGVTRHHLARGFAEHVGISPKVFARVMRVRRLLSLARSRPQASWTELAYDGGFFDQSHLVREMKAVIGVTPSEWPSLR